MKKNNSIKQIFEKIKRQDNYFHRSNIYELEATIDLINSFKETEPNLLSYIPIKLVTIMECYFKSIVKEFVDHDVIYANSLIDYLKDIHIDMDFITFLSGKLITVGSIISEIVRLQRVDSFFDIMSKLLGKNFIKKKYDNYLNYHGEPKISFYFLKKSLLELNSQRNIIVHANANLVIDKMQLKTYVQHTKLLLDATNELVDEILYPNSPTTQYEMNQSAFEKSEEINKRIRKFIADICLYIKQRSSKEQVKQFLIYYHQREKSIKEYGKLQADFYEGGSMYPLIYYSAITSGREIFFDELKKEFTNYNNEIEIHPLNL
ncbi:MULTISPECIES: hypothetical protein [Legionella]|uniref:Uncharacterized protein n=2 Tax=Legionella TaxID=445 RepID=D3HTJ1_LEGLN|nr:MULTISPECIES: hypothetical protein [Legionella]CBJ12233.1 hypothetical protein LLO_1855 [Legionella longbeachae NSW150]